PVRVNSIYLHRDSSTHLWPPRATVFAARATVVVMHHHPGADACMRTYHPGTNRDDHPARLMSPDQLTGNRVGGPAVEVEVTSAHSRSLHLDHDLSRARYRVG